jgi:hypothetical protein
MFCVRAVSESGRSGANLQEAHIKVPISTRRDVARVSKFQTAHLEALNEIRKNRFLM